MRLIRAAVICAIVILPVLAGEASAHPAWGLLLDRQGQIYFSDVQTNAVWKLDRELRLERVLAGKHSHSLFMDGAGDLFGEHVYYDSAGARWISSIWKLSPDGELTDLMAPTSVPPRGSGIFMDREGNIYSVQGGASESARVELLRRSPDGRITLIAGGERGHADGNGAQARFKSVIGMAWGPDGSLYLTDGSCVRRVALDGAVATIGGDPLAGLRRGEHPRLLGLAIDSRENIYVADYDYRCVQRITAQGAVDTILTDGFYWSPSGVAAVGDDVYVLEHQPETVVAVLSALNVGPYSRVRKLSRDGTVTTIATLWGRNTTLASGLSAGIVVLVVLAFRFRARRRANRELVKQSGS